MQSILPEGFLMYVDTFFFITRIQCLGSVMIKISVYSFLKFYKVNRIHAGTPYKPFVIKTDFVERAKSAGIVYRNAQRWRCVL